MTVPSCHDPSWSRRQWSLVMVAIFVFQAGLVSWLSENRTPTVRPAQPVCLVELTHQSFQDRLAPWSDPTLQAMAHQAGFSGSSWESAPALDHGLFRWTEPPRWLALDPQSLGTVDAIPHPETIIHPNAAPRLPRPTIGHLTVPDLPMQEATLVEIEDAWLKDRLNPPKALPVLHHTNVLKPTSIELAVTPQGRVLSARIIDTSGWDRADASGLDWVRDFSLRNESTTANSLLPSHFTARIGRVRIHWQTVPPGAKAHPTTDPAKPSPEP